MNDEDLAKFWSCPVMITTPTIERCCSRNITVQKRNKTVDYAEKQSPLRPTIYGKGKYNQIAVKSITLLDIKLIMNEDVFSLANCMSRKFWKPVSDILLPKNVTFLPR